MKDNNYVSQEEINAIEKINLDEDIINARKHNDENLFKKIQIKKALLLIKKTLETDETIDFYETGRNYSVDSKRLSFAASLMFSRYSHPIYRWNTNCLLIKTNKRFILAELTVGFDYSTHYDIDNKIHIINKDDNFYLIVDGNNQKTVVEFNNELHDITIDILKNAADIVIDKDFTIKNLRYGVSVSTIIMIYIIIVTIIFALLQIKH